MELYVHIPFCVRKCAYCAFDSFPGCSREEIERYISAVLREARLRQKEVTESIETAYIGGGTPSLVPADLMAFFLSELNQILDMSAVREFTSEANPGTVTNEWLDAVRSAGVNRLSFGVQSFQPDILKTLGRIHSAEEAVRSIELARVHGFENLNLDLIFGIPGQTMADWEETISAALALHPEHISAYGLIPEEGTPLKRKLDSGEWSLPDPDEERNMYDRAISRFREAGLAQYEISNFARKGFECRHNIGYWDQVPYLGLGLSAASMAVARPEEGFFSRRRTNPNTLEAYFRMAENEGETDNISYKNARFETVMLSLRMTKGMNRARFEELHGAPPESFFGETLEKLKSQGLLTLEKNAWRLTRRGMDIQNAVLLEFMD